MKEITLKIPDKKFRFFMELIESLGFVTVKEPDDSEASPYNPEFVANIEESKEQYKKGEFISVEKKDIKDFLGL